MGYVNYRPELEPREHCENCGWLVDKDGRCWRCGKEAKVQVNPQQLTLDSKVQLKLEGV